MKELFTMKSAWHGWIDRATRALGTFVYRLDPVIQAGNAGRMGAKENRQLAG